MGLSFNLSVSDLILCILGNPYARATEDPLGYTLSYSAFFNCKRYRRLASLEIVTSLSIILNFDTSHKSSFTILL